MPLSVTMRAGNNRIWEALKPGIRNDGIVEQLTE